MDLIDLLNWFIVHKPDFAMLIIVLIYLNFPEWVKKLNQ